jgi:hypothetical protein
MTRDWLVVGKIKPKGWPQSWGFPRYRSWPPGWTKEIDAVDGVSIHGEYHAGRLLITCDDKRYGDPSDALVDLYLQVIASTPEKVIRLRRPDDIPWNEGALLLVELLPGGGFGAEVELDVDRKSAGGDSIHFEVMVYGVSNSPTACVGVS